MDAGISLETLTTIALEGGEAVMAVYHSDFGVEEKDDASPVTAADRRCEELVAARLAQVAEAVPIIAEEAMAEASPGPDAPDAGAEAFFLVDPLDGTREFVSRNGDFTVNIALIEAGRPVAGVVLAPALGRIWAGAEGEGAFTAAVTSDGLGERRPIAVRRTGDEISVVASRSHRNPELDAFLARFGVAEYVSRGSSLKFCLLAEGEADLYPRLGRTMEWDTAAGDAVLRGAGGATVTLDGRSLGYGKREQTSDSAYANPHFVACGDPGLVGAWHSPKA